MSAEITTALQRREQRVALLRDLVSAFQKAQRVIVLSDLKGMTAHLQQQKELCAQLLVYGAGDEVPAPVTDPKAIRRWALLGADIEEQQKRVRHLSKVQDALLRRSRRAMEMFARLLASAGVTYEVSPAAMRAAGK